MLAKNETVVILYYLADFGALHGGNQHLKTARKLITLSPGIPETAAQYETFGQMLFGMQPDYPLVLL